ncbi:MAG TPA: DUF1203 domain-containing protein [Gemmatimonadaceae bacterium]|nr:DUF1203 domain-containing protein [Gemmatimonadaceae bacterium]
MRKVSLVVAYATERRRSSVRVRSPSAAPPCARARPTVPQRVVEQADTVPEVLASRLLAVRAFDAQHMMIDAEVCEGAQAAEMFERFLVNPKTSYLQMHNARRGCYAARVERA